MYLAVFSSLKAVWIWNLQSLSDLKKREKVVWVFKNRNERLRLRTFRNYKLRKPQVFHLKWMNSSSTSWHFFRSSKLGLDPINVNFYSSFIFAFLKLDDNFLNALLISIDVWLLVLTHGIWKPVRIHCALYDYCIFYVIYVV